MILTSNRVGTFDEAFKSRIQLSLHYPNLEEKQRLKIWTDFIARLEDLEEDMDVDSIREGLADLAKLAMNGRQIRNAVTTARQLARSRGRAMRLEDLNHVVNVSRRFDEYIEKLKGMTDDDAAEEEGTRGKMK